MKYGSVCSGIEAASMAWESLGWSPSWFAEVEAFPSAVLAHQWPHVENLGDMTKISRRVLLGEVEVPDVLVGGTPCQAFSVAGMREGLADKRGQLTIKFVELADAIDAARLRAGKPASIAVWENVPGVLSSKDNAFGCFLGALAGEDCELQPSGKRWSDAGCVYGPKRAIAWRILDAQYFGLAQRRRRVFVVASARQGFDPAAVLFEREGVRRDTAPRREEKQDAAGNAAPGAGVRCFGGSEREREIAACLTAKGQKLDWEVETLAVQAVTGDISHALNTANNGKGCSEDGTGRGVPTIACVHGTQDPIHSEHYAHAVGRNSGQENAVSDGLCVRRLMPTETEVLQGFPCGYTDVPYRGKPAADGPRYKAIGNSMAVPCMRWIGERIDREAR